MTARRMPPSAVLVYPRDLDVQRMICLGENRVILRDQANDCLRTRPSHSSKFVHRGVPNEGQVPMRIGGH